MSILKRTLIGAPAAMLVTAGLGLLMAGMIKVEHEAFKETPERLSFIINETPPDIDVIRTTDVPELRTVDIPPPPPVIATDTSDLPKIKLVEIDTKPPVLPSPEVEWTKATFTVSDRDAIPIRRIPPQMPTRFAEGNYSGHCKVRFDVSAQGSPYNVVITYCSNPILQRATVKSVLKWKFTPKKLDGEAVAMHGVENKVSFHLLDENGRRLPEL
jgi:protein TonB